MYSSSNHEYFSLCKRPRKNYRPSGCEIKTLFGEGKMFLDKLLLNCLIQHRKVYRIAISKRAFHINTQTLRAKLLKV